MNILLVCESSSDNLGDQAISQSAASLLSPDHNVSHLHLSEPSSGSPRSTQKQRPSRRYLRIIAPPKWRARLKWHLLGGKQKFVARITPKIKQSDGVIIGGGQLIKNNISLFCERLDEISTVCRDSSVPFAVLGVGVDSRMGAVSGRHAANLLTRATTVYIRDALSQSRAARLLRGQEETVKLVPDLAFFGQMPVSRTELTHPSSKLGINIMSFDVLMRQSNQAMTIDLEAYVQFWVSLVVEAGKLFDTITIFTSGAACDLEDAKTVWDKAHRLTAKPVKFLHPESLDELKHFFVSQERVIASRMHAGILAYVAGASVNALSWDDKVEGCWQLADEPNCNFSPTVFLRSDGPCTVLSTEPARPNDEKMQRLRLSIETAMSESINSLSGGDADS